MIDKAAASENACEVWKRPGHREKQVASRRASWTRIFNGEGFIYLAEVIGENKLKIGFSLKPRRRVTDSAGFESEGKRRLLATMPGSMEDEKALHRALRPVRDALGWGKGETYPRSILNHPSIPAELRGEA